MLATTLTQEHSALLANNHDQAFLNNPEKRTNAFNSQALAWNSLTKTEKSYRMTGNICYYLQTDSYAFHSASTTCNSQRELPGEPYFTDIYLHPTIPTG